MNLTPVCYDCLTDNVSVKVTDPLGFEHWFCAADWVAQEEFARKVNQMLSEAAAALRDDP